MIYAVSVPGRLSLRTMILLTTAIRPKMAAMKRKKPHRGMQVQVFKMNGDSHEKVFEHRWEYVERPQLASAKFNPVHEVVAVATNTKNRVLFINFLEGTHEETTASFELQYLEWGPSGETILLGSGGHEHRTEVWSFGPASLMTEPLRSLQEVFVDMTWLNTTHVIAITGDLGISSWCTVTGNFTTLKEREELPAFIVDFNKEFHNIEVHPDGRIAVAYRITTINTTILELDTALNMVSVTSLPESMGHVQWDEDGSRLLAYNDQEIYIIQDGESETIAPDLGYLMHVTWAGSGTVPIVREYNGLHTLWWYNLKDGLKEEIDVHPNYWQRAELTLTRDPAIVAGSVLWSILLTGLVTMALYAGTNSKELRERLSQNRLVRETTSHPLVSLLILAGLLTWFAIEGGFSSLVPTV